MQTKERIFLFDKEGKVPETPSGAQYRIVVNGNTYTFQSIKEDGVTWKSIASGGMETVTSIMMRWIPNMQMRVPQIVAPIPRKYTYFDRKVNKVARAGSAFLRIVDDGNLQIQIEQYKWATVMHDIYDKIEEQIKAYLDGIEESAVYYIPGGIPVKDKSVAKYKVLSYIKGLYYELYEGKSLIKQGNLRDILDYIKADKSDKSEIEGQMLKPIGQHNVVKTIAARLPELTYQFLDNYLYMCICRNKRISNNRIIDTRLRDSLGYPVYIMDCSDHDAPATLADVKLVDSLMQARALFPDLTDTVMPNPIQWSVNCSDYIWDLNLPVLPMSERAKEHIINERLDRFPEDLRSLSPTAILSMIKQSVEDGITKSSLDPTYPIPFYSRKYDVVNMLYPICAPTYNNGKPIAAILLNKTKTLGYEVATVLTLEMALNSCRAFRNPKNTWLREVI